MFHQISFAFATLCIVGSHGFFGSSSVGFESQPAICRLPSKPCRLQFLLHHLNGTLDMDLNTQTCSCAHPNSCSTDWSRSNYVISRNMLSTTHNVTMNMMFCQSVQPQRTCSIGEESLVVSGSLTIPYNVVAFNCRCADSTPLLLSSRTIGADYLYYHTYICNSHMPTCPRYNSYCGTLRTNGVSYNCKCSSGQHCQVPEGYPEPLSFASCRH